MQGLDILGAVTIPTAGANYTDAKTVTAVQAALVKKGYDLGDSGPNKDGVDGIFGSKTKAAIKKLQATIGAEQNGRIDEGVIAALQVTPGVLPPGVTAQGRAAVQAEAALDAATAAEHQAALDDPNPADVQTAAQQAVDAAPAQPPELKQAAQKALAQAKAATTPEQRKEAAQQTAAVAKDVHEAVKPSWLMLPAWEGGPLRWQLGLGLLGGIFGVGALAVTVGGPSRTVRK